MLWTVAAESTHNHPNQTESASCLICVVAHSASPAMISDHSPPLFAAVGLLPEQVVDTYARLDFSDAGIRGPPALL
jgi:hypothetical protein